MERADERAGETVERRVEQTEAPWPEDPDYRWGYIGIPTAGGTIARIVAIFLVAGIALGLGGVVLAAAADGFEVARAEVGSDTLLAALGIGLVVTTAVLLAVVGGVYAARALRDRPGAAAGAGFVGGFLGAATLALVFLAVAAGGWMAVNPGSDVNLGAAGENAQVTLLGLVALFALVGIACGGTAAVTLPGREVLAPGPVRYPRRARRAADVR